MYGQKKIVRTNNNTLAKKTELIIPSEFKETGNKKIKASWNNEKAKARRDKKGVCLSACIIALCKFAAEMTITRERNTQI